MRYAVYRCLYGEDFIQESIKSIDNYVDKIFVFWDDIPWGDTSECVYKGVLVQFPKKFDNIVDKIKELNNPKIELIYDHVPNNHNQFTRFINELILPKHPKPNTFIIPEVDHVFKNSEIEKALTEFEASGNLHACTKQIELWREPKYRIPERRRTGTVFWNMRGIDQIHPTHRQAESTIERINILEAYVHNFGFCANPSTMYWKHLTALAFSCKIGDDVPNEHWYDKWLHWEINNGLNYNLEISLGHEGNIPQAYEYNVKELPEVIQEKYGYSQN